MPLSPETKQAVRRYGPSVNYLARHRYGISGKDLLAKLIQGESGDRMGAVSTAGARGKTQFTAGSRDVAISKFGVDPWRSTDEAVHAAVLHLQGKINGSKGLEGYNPGDPNYPSYILGQGAHVSGRSTGGGGGLQPQTTGPPALPGLTLTPGASTAGLIQSLLNKPDPAPVGALRPSATAAHAALPAGYQGIQSSGGPRSERDLSGLLEALSAQNPGLPSIGSPQATGDAQNAGNAASGSPKGRGRVVFDPNADRAGASTNPAVLRFAREVSAIAGVRIRIGTGTNHSRLTVDGNVSQHWTGDAADIPATGRRLIRLGQAALIAAGMSERQARRQTGGLFNVHGRQVIFNTHEGGDHTNHLHIGL